MVSKKVSEALRLAQLWLVNSVPVVVPEGPKPMPEINNAIPLAEAMEAVVQEIQLIATDHFPPGKTCWCRFCQAYRHYQSLLSDSEVKR